MERSPWFWSHNEPFSAPMLAWLAVYGNLLLALRHPANNGLSRSYVEEFVRDLGRFLLSRGALTRQQLAQTLREEKEYGTNL